MGVQSVYRRCSSVGQSMGFISPGSSVRIRPPLMGAYLVSLGPPLLESWRPACGIRATRYEIRTMPPSSSGLGYRVLIPATGVRVPLGVFSYRPRSRLSSCLGRFCVYGCLWNLLFSAHCGPMVPCGLVAITGRGRQMFLMEIL